jgi:hypothetical protein
VLWKNVVGVIMGLPAPNSHCWKNVSSLARFEASKPLRSAAIRFASAMNSVTLMSA